MLLAVVIYLEAAVMTALDNSSPLRNADLCGSEFRVHVDSSSCLLRKVCCKLFAVYKHYLKN